MKGGQHYGYVCYNSGKSVGVGIKEATCDEKLFRYGKWFLAKCTGTGDDRLLILHSCSKRYSRVVGSAMVTCQCQSHIPKPILTLYNLLLYGHGTIIKARPWTEVKEIINGFSQV